MRHDAFREPVHIFTGAGREIDIVSACEALAFLDTFPLDAAENSRVAAQRTCLTVLDGNAEPGEAERAFGTFARNAGILAAKPPEVAAASAALPGSRSRSTSSSDAASVRQTA